jgi:hypothetical protein
MLTQLHQFVEFVRTFDEYFIIWVFLIIPEEIFMDKFPEIGEIHFGEFVISRPVLQEIIYFLISLTKTFAVADPQRINHIPPYVKFLYLKLFVVY